MLNKGVDYCVQSKVIDPLGRFIIVKVEIEHNLYVLINVYAPNKDKENVKFFNDIVGSDFNCPLNPVLDKREVL